ncbi:MAG TPA: nucleotidyl transferase AbiEii/AbiGii toxin family protein [Solirubrobacterales bacterium]|nr:nucleotidyl transferase AbiEii/AbiGii toxin family protein [Solirubrobacterales bacterium]
MNRANIAMLERAAEALGELLSELVFVGGATIELWITDPGAAEFRPTDDVDVIVEIANQRDYYRFEDRLRRAGFQNHVEDGVICRFRQPQTGLVLDVMPTEASILGFENRWQKEAFPRSLPIELPSRARIQAAPPAYLLATKLEAFRSRGKGDLYGSRDFEDIISLIDGRGELVVEVSQCPEDLRGYVSEQLQELSGAEFFDSAAEGALKGGLETRERYETIVRPRIEALTLS